MLGAAAGYAADTHEAAGAITALAFWWLSYSITAAPERVKSDVGGDQGDSVRRQRALLADRVDTFVCRRLNADGSDIEAEVLAQPLPHRDDVRRQPGNLRNLSLIHI